MDKTTKDAWLGKKEELSADALEKRRSINKKLMLFGCLPILLFASVVIFFVATGDNTSSSSPLTEESQSQQHIQYIPGLSPSDVYLNMEKRGFNTEKSFDSENGNLWSSRYSVTGINYSVETFSYNTKGVVSVRASAMVDVNGKDIVSTKQFFQLVSTLPYTNASPEQASSWVDKNFNSDQATTQIGGVTFTMIAPSPYVRMLRIEVLHKEAS